MLLEAFLLPLRMDLVSAPSGKDSLLKPPVVKVDTVDMTSADVQGSVHAEGRAGVGEERPQSGCETDNDGSGDEWESESLYEDAIALVRDEQLREGGIYTGPTPICLEYSLTGLKLSLMPAPWMKPSFSENGCTR